MFGTSAVPTTTEACVLGTHFSVARSFYDYHALEFVLSGDGDDHGPIQTG